jgi:ferredoxin
MEVPMTTQEAMHTFVKETGGWVASQLEACTRCGMCAEACHFYQATNQPEYAPVWKMELLRRAYEQRFTLSGRIKLALGIERPVPAKPQHWADPVPGLHTLQQVCAGLPDGHRHWLFAAQCPCRAVAAGAVPADLMAVSRQVEEGSRWA